MRGKFLGALCLATVMVLSLAGQMREGYLDVYVAKVKPDKRAQFDALARKMAAANRKNKGDTWLSYEVMYGEQDNVYFVSTRNNYAAVEAATGAFMGALNKGLGAAGAAKLKQDFGATVISARTEIRRRRWDLSANAPSDVAAQSRLIGQSRFLRTTIVRVRPGRNLDFEAAAKAVKAAYEKANPNLTVFVSQASDGQQGVIFYFSTLIPSLGDLDKVQPIPSAMGEDGFQRFLKNVSETVLVSETIIGRYLPELSNPPDEVAAVAPDFWRPKPPPAPKTAEKPKAAEKK